MKRIYLPRGARVLLLRTAVPRRTYQYQRTFAKGMRGRVLVRQGTTPRELYMVKWDDRDVSFEPRSRLREVAP